MIFFPICIGLFRNKDLTMQWAYELWHLILLHVHKSFLFLKKPYFHRAIS